MANLTEKAHREMDELANRLFDAIARADVDAVEQAYAPDVVYWMNAMPESLGLDALLNLVRVFHQKVKNLHYEVESREFFPGGFVQRCRIMGEAASGKSFAVPLCLIIYVENGRIVRLYEYIDTASMMPVLS
jgi:ketosteroid isomerase-like protein